MELGVTICPLSAAAKSSLTLNQDCSHLMLKFDTFSCLQGKGAAEGEEEEETGVIPGTEGRCVFSPPHDNMCLLQCHKSASCGVELR